MPTQRQQRLGELLREEISTILRGEVRDPRLGFVTLTEVQVSPDIAEAIVYASVLGSPAEQESTMAALESAAGFIRGELGKVLRLRRVPHLQFRLDRSIERGVRIAELLEKAKQEDAGGSHGGGDSEGD